MRWGQRLWAEKAQQGRRPPHRPLVRGPGRVAGWGGKRVRWHSGTYLCPAVVHTLDDAEVRGETGQEGERARHHRRPEGLI